MKKALFESVLGLGLTLTKPMQKKLEDEVLEEWTILTLRDFFAVCALQANTAPTFADAIVGRTGPCCSSRKTRHCGHRADLTRSSGIFYREPRAVL